MSQRYRSARRTGLAKVAKETKAALPDILHQLPDIKAPESKSYDLNQLAPLNPEQCPGYIITLGDESKPGLIPHVFNKDTLDCAIALAKIPSRHPSPPSNPRVCVLNLASEKSPGGGWLGGALAQEESICFRSSLYMSLHQSYYPIPKHSGIYSPSVVLIRSAYGAGHELLVPARKASELDIISVVSIAAIRCPNITQAQKIVDSVLEEHDVFKHGADRELTKDKMRLTLRIAATEGHSRLVLGAMGCGAFKNPTEDVAICWREVLGEDEFAGGWFEEVVFAVLDKGSDGKNAGRDWAGNFWPFENLLGGVLFAKGKDPSKLEEKEYQKLVLDEEEDEDDEELVKSSPSGS